MKIRVLGSSAGGGFPQWNCNCLNCEGLRKGSIHARARTQSSIAVSENGLDWLLVNASPDLLAQIRANPVLQPARAPRDSGICAVLLIDAQIDHVTGLLMLRERGTPLPIYATEQVFGDLATGLPLTRVLSHYCDVEKHPIFDHPFSVPQLAQIEITPVPISSKAPPYSPHRDNPVAGDNIALSIRDKRSGASVFYAPGLGEVDDQVMALMREAQVVMVDGTFWTSDEMVRLGFSKKMAQDMGHLPQSGPEGMIEILDRIGTTRKILIHINNTNPILREDSEERGVLERHRIEVAYDGMELTV